MESRPEGARRRPSGPRRPTSDAHDESRAAHPRRPAQDAHDEQRAPRPTRPRPEGATPDRREGIGDPRRRRTGKQGRTGQQERQRTERRANPGAPRRPGPDGQRPRTPQPPRRNRPDARQRPASQSPDDTGAPAKPGVTRRPRQRRSGEIHTKGAAATTSASTREQKPQGHDDQGQNPPPPARGALAAVGGFGRKAWGRGLIALVSVAVLVCTGYAWSSVNGLTSKITQLGGLDLGGGDDGATDILLVGTDSRTDAKGNPLSSEELKWLRAGDDISTNTDTVLLIRIPNDGSSATAISIPRDSYVSVPGIGLSKINAAYGTTREGARKRAVEAGKPEEDAEREGTLAGRKALIDTVADLTGVKVDHYAEVGLLGFALLTKAVGGVEVCLKDAVNEPLSGARFKAGRQTLNGPQALSFVRQRHELPRGDLDRITRQQVYMASLTQKILSAHTLTDPSKLNELEDAVSRSVVIDDDWNVVQFAEQLKDLSGGRVKFATIPVLDEQGWSEDGQQSVVTVDPNAVHTFTSNLLNDGASKSQSRRGDYTVDVDNAGTIDGLASNVSNILTNKGFQAGKTSSTPADIKDSVIYAHSADNPGAQLLAKDLRAVRVEAQPDLDEHHLKLVLTNTFAGPGSINDVGTQTDNTPASQRVGNNAPPITAGTDGPVCVN